MIKTIKVNDAQKNVLVEIFRNIHPKHLVQKGLEGYVRSEWAEKTEKKKDFFR